jgi:hypothetical protein
LDYDWVILPRERVTLASSAEPAEASVGPDSKKGLGLEWSLSRWAVELGRDRNVAAGILIATLALLEARDAGRAQRPDPADQEEIPQLRAFTVGAGRGFIRARRARPLVIHGGGVLPASR